MSHRSTLARVAIALPLLASPSLATPALAQRAAAVPTTALRTPVAEFAEPFTNLVALRELRDGRVIVVDRAEKRVELLDLARGTATSVGREGGGPGEWRQPSTVLPLPGDSSLLVDPLTNRMHVVAPDGRIARSVQPPPNPRSQHLSFFPRATDAQGRMYFVDAAPSGGTAPSSGTVRSVDLRTGAMQEHGTVALRERTIAAASSGSSVTLSNRSRSALPAQDAWAVGTDGRVALVRHDPYRVEWVAPNGQRVTGPVIAYTPVRVTEADKAARASAGSASRTYSFGGGTAGAPPAAPPRPAAQEWPAVKPPFLNDAARVAPDGRVWVLRTRAADDPIPAYDVLDGAGALVARVTLPAGTHLLGFGTRSVYLVRTDADDLEYLQRYQLP
jgi:hypothetical protein